jgi:hypothetical protein
VFVAQAIINIEALRMAEGSIFVSVEVFKNNSRSTLTGNHQASGNRIIISIEECFPSGMGTQVTGKGSIQFKVWDYEADINSIEYVDVYYKDDSQKVNL